MKLVFPEELFSSARKTGNNNLKKSILLKTNLHLLKKESEF